MWINRHHYVFPLLTLAATFLAGQYIDLTYAVLRVLALLHIVWDLHEVPADVLAQGRMKPAAASGLLEGE